MTYLIVAILIILYYLFGAPKSVRNTMNMIVLVGILAILGVLATLTFFKILQSPAEVYVAVAMVILGYYTLKDLWQMPVKKR